MSDGVRMGVGTDVGALLFPNKFRSSVVGAVAFVAEGAMEEGGSTDPEVFGLPKEDSSGGVFGLPSLIGAAFSSSRGSVFTAPLQSPKAGLGDAGCGFGGGADFEGVLTCSSPSSSSSRNVAVVARGELRTGRVLGLPRPNPNGEDTAEGNDGMGAVMGGSGVIEELSLAGDPGGVVEGAWTGEEGTAVVISTAPDSGEGVTWILGVSG